MVLLNQESRLLTGSADSELRAWDLRYLQEVRRHTEDAWLSIPVHLISDSLTIQACICVHTERVCLSLQEKAEGEPEVKKGKTLLGDDDDDDDDDTQEGGDEGLEEVQEM